MKGQKNTDTYRIPAAGRLSRKNAMPMEEVIKEYIRSMKIASGLNEQLVYDAWDTVSGAAGHTVSRFYRNGTLYCSLSSSVLRSRLYPRLGELVEKINGMLLEDELFVRDDPKTGTVRKIVLQ